MLFGMKRTQLSVRKPLHQSVNSFRPNLEKRKIFIMLPVISLKYLSGIAKELGSLSNGNKAFHKVIYGKYSEVNEKTFKPALVNGESNYDFHNN